MSLNNKFLEKYKELEILLRTQNIDFKNYEEEQEDSIKQKLRICRMMRNYISHNDSVFVETTKNQINFLQDTINYQRLQGDIVKKTFR